MTQLWQPCIHTKVEQVRLLSKLHLHRIVII